MRFRNSTTLDGARLQRMLERHTAPYAHDALGVSIRYSRSSAFSGACYYADSRIFVNLGRRNRYPFAFDTHTAKARTRGNFWLRDRHRLVVSSPYELTLFVYLHELYHFLVKSAGRCVRRKESMCDRFAARVLVDHYGCPLVDARSRPVPREAWDFQDLEAFVAAAPRQAAVLLTPLPRNPAPAAVVFPGLPVPLAATRGVPTTGVEPPLVAAAPSKAATHATRPTRVEQLRLWNEPS